MSAKNCEYCHKQFEAPKRTQRFCSYSCASKARPSRYGDANANWRGGKVCSPRRYSCARLNIHQGVAPAQSNNSRNCRFITHNGKTQTITKWASDHGLNLTTLSRRLDGLNWTFAEAISAPINTKLKSIRGLCKDPKRNKNGS